MMYEGRGTRTFRDGNLVRVLNGEVPDIDLTTVESPFSVTIRLRRHCLRSRR